jgi:hypothetical protein
MYCCCLGTVLCWTPGARTPAAAQPDATPANRAFTEATIIGVIMSVGDDFLVVAKSDESQVRVTTDASTMLMFEGREATLDDMKPGCLATVMAVEEGGNWRARMVQATLRH